MLKARQSMFNFRDVAKTHAMCKAAPERLKKTRRFK